MFKYEKHNSILKKRTEQSESDAFLNPTPTGRFWVKFSLQAAWFNILKYTIIVPLLVGVVEEEHPYKCYIRYKDITI